MFRGWKFSTADEAVNARRNKKTRFLNFFNAALPECISALGLKGDILKSCKQPFLYSIFHYMRFFWHSPCKDRSIAFYKCNKKLFITSDQTWKSFNLCKWLFLCTIINIKIIVNICCKNARLKIRYQTVLHSKIEKRHL